MEPFTDSFGNTFQLEPGLRDQLKPWWKGEFEDFNYTYPTQDEIEKSKLSYRGNANYIENNLRTLGKTLVGSRVLEVGIDRGQLASQLALLGPKHVTATDVVEHSIYSTHNEFVANKRDVNKRRNFMRKVIDMYFDGIKNIEFIEDDICETKLKRKFDIIISHDVLEHVLDPFKAIKNMLKLLSNDGLVYIYYNPFFCVIGGHSLCTLDIPWGHVVLNESDYFKYLKKYRPTEIKSSGEFYKYGLNRFGLNDLFKCADFCNIVDYELIVPDRGLPPEFTSYFFQRAKKVHPYILRQDLITEFVRVIISN